MEAAAVEKPYHGDQEQEEKRVVLLESSTTAAHDEHREAHGKEESVLKVSNEPYLYCIDLFLFKLGSLWIEIQYYLKEELIINIGIC